MRTFFFTLAIVFSASCFGQSTSWKELDDFHLLVSKVLHPVENGNLKPLTDSSQALLNKAKAWQSARPPAGSQYPDLSKDLQALVTDCDKLNVAIIEKKPKSAVKALAMQTHVQFHVILQAEESKPK